MLIVHLCIFCEVSCLNHCPYLIVSRTISVPFYCLISNICVLSLNLKRNLGSPVLRLWVISVELLMILESLRVPHIVAKTIALSFDHGGNLDTYFPQLHFWRHVFRPSWRLILIRKDRIMCSLRKKNLYNWKNELMLNLKRKYLCQ